MEYYDNKGNIHNFELGEPFNHGCSAEVFMLDDKTVFKRYYGATDLVAVLGPQEFKILKSINHPHFINLLEYYYDVYSVGDMENFLSKIDKWFGDAYTYEYIKGDNVNILDSSEYIINNMHELEGLVEIFTSESLRLDDVKDENAVFTKDRIILIDPDCFKKDDMAKDTLTNENKQCLYRFFRGLLIKEASKYEPSRSRAIEKLMTCDLINEKSMALGLSKRLRGYPKITDILRK